MKRRIFSMIFALIIILNSFDVTVFAQEAENEDNLLTIEDCITINEQMESDIQIIGFDDLDESVGYQHLTCGAAESDIFFPEKLSAVVEIDGIEQSYIFSDISWVLDSENSDSESFDSSCDGTVFTYYVQIPEGYLFSEKADLPCIVVAIGNLRVSAPVAYSIAAENTEGFLAPIDDPDASAVMITTAEELAAISDNMYGSYVLMNDIDLTEYGEWIPIGKTSDNAFHGKFDGQGHKISGLTVSQNYLIAVHHPVGLFGVCDGAQIKNVAIENANVLVNVYSGYEYNSSSENITAGIYAGAIAGYTVNNTVIYNCYASGSVLVKSEQEGRTESCAGGLIGGADTALISYSYNLCEVQAYNGDALEAHNANAGGVIGIVESECIIDKTYNCGTVSSVTLDYGDTFAGGLIGYANNASVTLTDCFNAGQIKSLSGNMFCDDAYAGGIAGFISGSIERVYNSGTVVAQANDSWGINNTNAYAGGICGVCSTSSTISNSAIVQAVVSATASSAAYQYRIAYQGNKNNNVTISSVTSGSINDASIIKTIDDMKSSDVYKDTLGWDFNEIWEMKDGKEFPQLKQVQTGSSEYNQEYIEQHLEFINGEAYQKFLSEYRWAQIYWSEENNFKSNAAGALYDGIDTAIDLATLNFGVLFEDNDPFKVILADYVSDQTVAEEVVNLYKVKVPFSLDQTYTKVKNFIKDNWKDEYGELSETDLFWLFHYEDKTSDEWINNDFEKHLYEIVYDEKSKGFDTALGITTETLDSILEQKKYLDNTIDWMNGLINYAGEVAAYIQADEDFQAVLAEMCNNLADTTETKQRYKKQLKNALESYTMYNTPENITENLFAYYIKDSLKGEVSNYIQKHLEDKVSGWLESVLSASAWAAYNAVTKAADMTWKVMDYVTKNGELQECREMLRANAYFEETMYYTLLSFEGKFKSNPSFEQACLFDAAFKFFKETEIASMDVVIQYLDTYQTSWIAAIRNGSNSFLNSAIEEVHINKLFIYKTYCHGISYALGGKVITIACPTDVHVYDECGELVVSIEKDRVTNCKNGIFAYTADAVKLIIVPTDQDYKIKIEATNDGSMNYSVSEYSANGENVQKTLYSDIPIRKGETYAGTVNSEIKTEPKVYNLESDSEVTIDDYVLIDKNSNVPVEKILIKTVDNVMNIGDTFSLKVDITPQNASDKTLVWSSTDKKILSVDETGKITALSKGEATVTVQSICGGISDSVTMIVYDEEHSSEDVDINDILPEDLPSDGIIPDGIWVAGIADKDYTGINLKQSFRVYDGNKLLKEKTDYTVSYKNQKNAYIYTDEDYAAFEEKLIETGKRIKTGTFDPAKAPQITIKMKGNYAGSQTIYYKINPADLTDDAFKAENLAVTYTGKKQTPVPKLYWNGKALKYGTDFYVQEYDDAKKDKNSFTDSGLYDLTLVGKKNFTGEISITFTVSDSAKQLTMNKVTVKGIKNMSWTGKQLTQSDFSVYYKKDILSEENGDYTLDWGINTDVGTGTLTLTGTGLDQDGDGYSYIGTRIISFKITGTSMSKVSVSGIEKSYIYNGEEIKPEPVLTYKANKNEESVILTEGIHYELDYQKSTNKGTATIAFTGLPSGGFSGTKKVTYKIVPRGIADIKENETNIEQIHVIFKDTQNMQDGIYIAPYMKGGAKPEVIVTNGEKTLVQGIDYTVSYMNHKRVALSTDSKAPTVIIKGTGNYTGSKKVTFTIVPKALNNENRITVSAKDKVVSTKKYGYRQSFKVYDADGKALGTSDYDSKNVIYTLLWTENEHGVITEVNEVLDKNSIVPANSMIQITVSGKGNYAGGSVTGTYRILESNHDISKAIIQINNQTYTGNPVLITEQSQFKNGKVYIKTGQETKILILGEDIEVVPGSYIKNINQGTAKVTFRGINEFGGTKTVSFRIGTRSISICWKGIYSKIKELFE